MVCTHRKGRRICKLHNNEIVCSLCCAESRNSGCEGCPHYVMAKQYVASKAKEGKPKHFIAEIKPEVERTVNKALKLVEKGEIEKGESIISELKKDHPRNHTIYYGLGVVHALKGEHDEAIEYFDKAIDIFPYFLEAHFNKGVAYQKKFDIGNMIKAFKEVVTIGDPKDSHVQQAQDFIEKMEQYVKETDDIDLETYLECQEKFNEAYSYMEKGEWKKALDGFKAVLSKTKKHPQSYGNMGICYACLGQREQALAAFDKALEIDPSYEPALTNRAAVESLKEGEKLEQAIFESVDYYKDSYLKKKSSR